MLGIKSSWYEKFDDFYVDKQAIWDSESEKQCEYVNRDNFFYPTQVFYFDFTTKFTGHDRFHIKLYQTGSDSSIQTKKTSLME